MKKMNNNELKEVSSKRVLVVGGAGYIGGHTVDHLQSHRHKVTVYDNLTYENRFLKDVGFVYGDIRDTERVVETAKLYDVVVLMAALVGDPACSVDPVLTNEINHIAIKNICQQLPEEKHVIFMSTCSVYGAQTEMLDEESPTNPLSSYASTKLKAEQYVKERNGTIFRLGTVYGLADRYSRIRLDLVVNVLTMKAVYDKKINIFGGEQWRPLICVKDIAGYVKEALEEDIRGTYILSEGNYTMKMLGELFEGMYPDIEVEYTDISFEDARNYMVNNVKSEQTFKYRPRYDIQEEIYKLNDVFEEGRIRNVKDLAFHNGRYIKDWVENNQHKIS
jgi:nucleoside-diphosphate-sugar epimerase